MSLPRPELRWLFAGVVATLSMDVATGIATRLGVLAPLPPALVGRWFACVAQGRPILADITHAPNLRYEIPLAFGGHYAIGITLACVFLWLTARLGLPAGSPRLALAYGVSSSVLAWLVMFPAMGYGFFGIHGPEGTHLFRTSLAAHTMYGLGLWLGVRWLLPPPWRPTEQVTRKAGERTDGAAVVENRP